MLLAASLTAALLCQPPAPVRVGVEPVTVLEGIEYLSDPDGRLTRDALISPRHCGDFAPLQGVPRFGGTDASIWLRFRLSLPEMDTPWQLSVNYAALSQLCVHWPVTGGAYRSLCSDRRADAEPAAARDGSGYRFDIPRDFDSNRPVLIKLASPLWVKAPIEVGSAAAMSRSHKRREFGWGLYFGILMTLALYGAAVACDARSRLYGLYAAHFATLALGLAAWQGRMIQLGLPDWTATRLPGLLFGLFVLFGGRFYQRLLDTRDGLPLTHRVLSAASAIALAGALLSLWKPNSSLLVIAVATLLFVPATLYASLRRAMQGFRPAIYVIAAMGPLLLCALLKAGQAWGVVLVDPELLNAIGYACTVFGASLLVFALGQGGRLQERERSRAAELSLSDHQVSLLRARFDGVTGLAGRDKFVDDLRELLRRSATPKTPLAVITVSLDKFRSINHALGFSVGDAVLREIADRLRSRTAQGDLLARIGPDIFGLVTHITADRDARLSNLVDLCADVQEAVGEPLRFGEGARLGASIGVALYPDHGVSADALIRHSDAAMYHAKGIGGGAFEVFKPELMRDADRHLKLSRMLRTALANDEFELHYQPIISLETGRISALEALLRWTTADGQTIPPDLFVPIAESSDLIVGISNWVINAACIQLADWQRRDLTDAQHVAVNLSPRQFRDPRLVDTISAAMRRHGVPPGSLSVELTEGVVIDDLERSRAVLEQLRGLGIGIAIDDFGVGFSSLSYLRDLPVTSLKIDRSFLRGAPDEQEARTVISTIVRLGRDLKLRVIAEGIETVAQRDFLAQAGCHDGQGFLFCRAMPARELELWFENRNLRFAIA